MCNKETDSAKIRGSKEDTKEDDTNNNADKKKSLSSSEGNGHSKQGKNKEKTKEDVNGKGIEEDTNNTAKVRIFLLLLL